MSRTPAARATLTLIAAALCTLALAACGSTVATSAYSGEQRAVAQTISNLQADATAAEQKKICANDVSAEVVNRLGGTAGCEAAIKSQLGEVDNLEAKIKSIDVAAGATTATAQVSSTFAGKSTTATVSLVKEGKVWKVSGVS